MNSNLLNVLIPFLLGVEGALDGTGNAIVHKDTCGKQKDLYYIGVPLRIVTTMIIVTIPLRNKVNLLHYKVSAYVWEK